MRVRERTKAGRRLALLASACALALALPALARAAVLTAFNPVTNVLTITTTAGDGIDVQCVAGFVRINGFDPLTGPAACPAVQHIVVNGDAGPNIISLGLVDPAGFPALLDVLVEAGGGNDQITTGSAGVETVHGGPGNDFIGAFDGGNAILDGEDGADVYNVSFGSPTSATVNDTGPALPLCPPVCGPDNFDSLSILGTAFNDNGGAGVGDRPVLEVFDGMTSHGAGETVFYPAGGGLEFIGVAGQDGNDIVDASASTRGFGLFGDAGNDHLIGGTGNDRLFADDECTGGGCPPPPPPPPGDDVLQGGPGDDTL